MRKSTANRRSIVAVIDETKMLLAKRKAGVETEKEGGMEVEVVLEARIWERARGLACDVSVQQVKKY